MSKTIVKFSILFISIFILYLLCFRVSTNVSILSENTATLDNPSRGYYIQVDSSNIYAFDYLDEGIRLILVAFNIEDFKDCEISLEKLDELEAFLSLGSEYGVKFIFRAAYGFTSDAYYNDVDNLEIIETHISQIAPILNEYQNVIHCVQAGFIGPWGEWHASLLLDGLTDDEQAGIKNELISLLLTNIDESIPIAVRCPSFIVDAQDAGIDTSRLCIHNDGLFGSESDLGTYDKERTEAIEEWNTVIGASTNGGEMPYVSEWTDPNLVNEEMYLMKISYLNGYYNTAVLDSWSEDTLNGENALSYITNHLGYRFYISEITTIDNVSPLFLFRYIPLEITLSNSGYSEIESSYIAELIIKSGDTIVDTVEIDDLDTLSFESALTINTSIFLNRSMVDNGVSIGIKIYDIENEGNLLYHVELANDEVTYVDGINWIEIF